MDGDFGDIKNIVKIAKKYKALTYLDEVHAVGMYCQTCDCVDELMNLLN